MMAKFRNEEPDLIEASDGTLHAFPHGTSDAEIERYMWRYENGQDLPDWAFSEDYENARCSCRGDAYMPPPRVEVTAQKSGELKPVRLEGFENPGAVFDSREAAAHDITGRINPLSRSQNREYSWMYYTDPVSGKIGYSDPYESGEVGGQNYGLGFSVGGAVPKASDGRTLTQANTFGMGHTHGAGSANKFSSRWDRDSNGRPLGRGSDEAFMERGGATGKWNFFTLGTPDGNFRLWTPKKHEEDLLDAEWGVNQASSEFLPPRKPEYFRRRP